MSWRTVRPRNDRIEIEVKAFNPDQPREPAGSERGGQFAAAEGGGGGGEERRRKPVDQAAADAADRALGQTAAQERAVAMERGRQRAQKFHERQRANREAKAKGLPLPFPGKAKLEAVQPEARKPAAEPKPEPQPTGVKPVGDKDSPVTLSPEARAAAEKSLKREERIQSASEKRAYPVEGLGGGISLSSVMKLDDGTKVVWKPQVGEPSTRGRDPVDEPIRFGHQTAREVGAWEAAKVFGMEDIGSATVRKNLEGIAVKVPDRHGDLEDVNGDGAMMEFHKGYRDAGWDGASRLKYEHAERDLFRAAIFDHVIGNTDRHGGNWMMSPDRNNFKLIDHGYAFPDRRDYSAGNQIIVDRAIRKLFSGALKEKEYKGWFESFRGKADSLRDRLERSGLPENEIREAVARLRDVEGAKGERELRYVLERRYDRLEEFRRRGR